MKRLSIILLLLGAAAIAAPAQMTAAPGTTPQGQSGCDPNSQSCTIQSGMCQFYQEIIGETMGLGLLVNSPQYIIEEFGAGMLYILELFGIGQ